MNHSSNFNSYAILALVLFVVQFPFSSSKPGASDEAINNAIQDAVNDGFTITKEDKEYFDNIIKNSKDFDEFDGDLRIVSGGDTELGEINKLEY